MGVALSDFNVAFEISKYWYRGNDHICEDIKVRGISLYVASQLYVFQTLVPELATNSQSGSFVKFLKRNGLDWHVKLVASRFCPPYTPKMSDTLRYVVLYDTHNNAMVDCVTSVATELICRRQTVIPITADPKIAKRAKGTCPPLGYSKYYGLADEIECNRIWRQNIKQLRSAIGNLVQLSDKLPSNNIDIPRLQKTLEIFMKQTIRDIIAMDNMYNVLNPDVVIMGSDSHKLARISALISERKTWKTLVLQHGAPMLPHAYVPVHANWIAVWGESFRRWFVGHEVPFDKIIVTGCPRFDAYVPKLQSEAKRKIVWLTTPTKKDIIASCFAHIRPVLFDLGLEFVIKTHPSEPTDGYRALVAGSGYQAKSVLSDLKMYDLINKGDIVFCLNSSAGIEAVALGGLLFVIQIDGVPNSIEYGRYGVAKEIRDPSEAISNVKEFMAFVGTKGYKENVKAFIADHLGVLDGKSAERVCDFVINIASQ
jgi:hypothetical protein